MMNDGFTTGPGERLLWSGRPDPWRYVLRNGIPQLLAGILFLAFMVVYCQYFFGVEPSRFPWLMKNALLAGFVQTLLTPAWYFYRAALTTYALTSQRAVIDFSGLFPRRRNIPLAEIRFVKLSSLSLRGVGNVLFCEPPPYKFSYRMGTIYDGFIAIADAAQVEQQFRAAIAKFPDARLGPIPRWSLFKTQAPQYGG